MRLFPRNNQNIQTNCYSVAELAIYLNMQWNILGRGNELWIILFTVIKNELTWHNNKRKKLCVGDLDGVLD
jgi:hypothetical protein